MKHLFTRRAALTVALLLALALTLTACTNVVPNVSDEPTQAPAQTEAPAVSEAPVSTEASEDTSVTATDMMGREITLDAPATGIVALTAADCEILYAIGAGDAVIGRGEYCDYPAEVLDVPSVQSGYETNIEQIIALAPQVLFTSAMDQSKEQLEQLEAAGIQVVVSDADDIAGVYTSIELLGKLTGHDGEAAALIASMKATFDELVSLAAGGEEKTVYFEVSPLEYGLWTAGSGTFMNEIANLIGLKNCFEDVTGWGEISEEQVIERNPDYIVTVSMYFGEGPTPVEEILARAGWGEIKAVKNGAILNLQNNELTRPAPRLTDGAKALYEFVYVTMAEQDAA